MVRVHHTFGGLRRAQRTIKTERPKVCAANPPYGISNNHRIFHVQHPPHFPRQGRKAEKRSAFRHIARRTVTKRPNVGFRYRSSKLTPIFIPPYGLTPSIYPSSPSKHKTKKHPAKKTVNRFRWNPPTVPFRRNA